jgi:hypothetical protein
MHSPFRPVSLLSYSAVCFDLRQLFVYFSGDDEEEEGGEEGAEPEEKMPTCGDYIMHFLTLFWKVIFAFIPPAGKFLIVSTTALWTTIILQLLYKKF